MGPKYVSESIKGRGCGGVWSTARSVYSGIIDHSRTQTSLTKHGNLHLDGLHQTAYVGSVFGNPPFDGYISNKSTINHTLGNAAEAGATTIGFRAVFPIPLTQDKLTLRLTHPSATLLMKCPNDSIPFIPDSKWYGNDRRTGCSKESHTHLVLLMYQSENNGPLSNINMLSLNQKLANLYLHIAPINK